MKIGRPPVPPEIRFWKYVHKEIKCWTWIGYRDKNGYGRFGPIGKVKKDGAHRVSWVFNKGIIPKGKCVLHICDNPPCVNPKHLFIGTTQDNTRDAVRKKRHAYGSKNGNSKLSEKEIMEIRSKYSTGKFTQQKLADEYCMGQPQIGQIVKFNFWKHI